MWFDPQASLRLPHLPLCLRDRKLYSWFLRCSHWHHRHELKLRLPGLGLCTSTQNVIIQTEFWGLECNLLRRLNDRDSFLVLKWYPLENPFLQPLWWLSSSEGRCQTATCSSAQEGLWRASQTPFGLCLPGCSGTGLQARSLCLLLEQIPCHPLKTSTHSDPRKCKGNCCSSQWGQFHKN